MFSLLHTLVTIEILRSKIFLWLAFFLWSILIFIGIAELAIEHANLNWQDFPGLLDLYNFEILSLNSKFAIKIEMQLQKVSNPIVHGQRTLLQSKTEFINDVGLYQNY